MSEDIDSRRDDMGATAPTPRVAVEPTPQTPAGQVQPGPGATAQSPFNAGDPYAAQTQTVAHTVVKTKTKKLPVFLCSLAGMVVGAVLVVALIMTGALNVNRDAGTATATTDSSGGTQTIKIDSEDTTLAEAVSAKALPSVVSITAWSSGSSESVMQGDDSESSGSIGSGVVLDTDGNVLTNNHVVEGATDITVSLNGESYEAELVGADTSSDLAVIKIKDVDAKNLTPIEVGDSDGLNVGEWVMAIGSPFGNEQSVSTGIVSSLYRSTALPTMSGTYIYANMIQTDAAINPGNSGGALVNDRGQLVGICTLYSSDTESFAGIGFAIPGNYAVDVAQKIVNGEQVTHAYIGLSMQTVNAQNAKANKLSVSQGAYVAEVTSGSPADEAGIQKGDIIVGIGGTQITSADGAILAVRSHSIGETVQVTVMRGNDEKTFDVTLGSDEELQRQQEEANSQPVSDINSYVNGNGNGNGSGQDNSQLLQQFQQWLQQQQEGYGYGQRQR